MKNIFLILGLFIAYSASADGPPKTLMANTENE